MFRIFNKPGYRCKICDNSEHNLVYKVKELMMGLRDTFTYFECSQCGCLQIARIPVDMSRYYPKDYYSFISPGELLTKNPLLKSYLDKLKDLGESGDGNIGELLFANFPDESLQALSRTDITKNSRILDVGCGSGSQLYVLNYIGFRDLLGIDRYIQSDITYENGLTILKGSIDERPEVQGEWDLIMFHHSFEHFPDPIEVLRSCSKLLAKKGICLIRIPTVSSFAWKYYKTSWVQLDAPRHLFLPSLETMEVLASRGGLKVKDVVYDSTEFQFWGSEQYLKNIPLFSHGSLIYGESNSIFSFSEIESFRERAKELNAQKQGDQAVFYLESKQ